MADLTVPPRPKTPPIVQALMVGLKAAGLRDIRWNNPEDYGAPRVNLLGRRSNGHHGWLSVFTRNATVRHMQQLVRLVEIVEAPHG